VVGSDKTQSRGAVAAERAPDQHRQGEQCAKGQVARPIPSIERPSKPQRPNATAVRVTAPNPSIRETNTVSPLPRRARPEAGGPQVR